MAETEIATKPAAQEPDSDLSIFRKEAYKRGYRTKEELREFAKIKAHEEAIAFFRSLPPPWPTLPREPIKPLKTWEHWKNLARQSEQEERDKNDRGSQ